MLEFQTALFGKVFADWLPSWQEIRYRHQVLYWTVLAAHKILRKSLIGFLDFYGQFVHSKLSSVMVEDMAGVAEP